MIIEGKFFKKIFFLFSLISFLGKANIKYCRQLNEIWCQVAKGSLNGKTVTLELDLTASPVTSSAIYLLKETFVSLPCYMNTTQG